MNGTTRNAEGIGPPGGDGSGRCVGAADQGESASCVSVAIEAEVHQASEAFRWRTLSVLALMQFMLVLDMTVVNVALPRVQEDLHFTHATLAWVVNGYVITAGGLLLLGGRLADLYGRRRLFLLGVAVFALASVASGAAATPGMLIAARFVQGFGEALAARAAVGIIVVLFINPAERAKALGVWGGLAGIAGVTGSVISGVLTDLLDWRLVFYINVPVSLVVLAAAPRLIPNAGAIDRRGSLDVWGAVTGTLALMTLVFGFLQASSVPWTNWRVLSPLMAGVCLVALTVAIEKRVRSPLVPLTLFTNRVRVVGYTVTLMNIAGFFTYVFLLTLFEQQVLGFSPLESGLSYLPLGLTIGVGVGISTSLTARVGVRTLVVSGLLGIAVGLWLTSSLRSQGSYFRDVLPGMIVVGLFSGIAMPAAFTIALHMVPEERSSIASAMANVMQQMGGALGLACLVALAAHSTADGLRQGLSATDAAAHGYSISLRVSAGLLLAAALIAMAFLGRVAAGSRGSLS